jgi:hypothetical protein
MLVMVVLFYKFIPGFLAFSLNSGTVPPSLLDIYISRRQEPHEDHGAAS